METTILVAIITAVTSMLISIITVFFSNRTHKSSEKTQFNLEKFKQDQILIREKRDGEARELARQINAIAIAVTKLQILKDELQFLILSAHNSDQEGEMRQRVKDAVRGIFDSYESNMITMRPDDARLLHEAKNAAFLLHYIFQAKENKIIPVNDYIKRLDAVRRKLSEYQARLQEASFCTDNQLAESSAHTTDSVRLDSVENTDTLLTTPFDVAIMPFGPDMRPAPEVGEANTSPVKGDKET